MLTAREDQQTLTLEAQPVAREQASEDTGTTTLTFVSAWELAAEGEIDTDWLVRYVLAGHPAPTYLIVEES